MNVIQSNLIKPTLVNRQQTNINNGSLQNTKFDQELDQASKDLESIFVQQLLKEARKTPLTEDSLFPKSHAMEIYEGMIDEHIADKMAEQSAFGLASFIKNNLKRT